VSVQRFATDQLREQCRGREHSIFNCQLALTTQLVLAAGFAAPALAQNDPALILPPSAEVEGNQPTDPSSVRPPRSDSAPAATSPGESGADGGAPDAATDGDDRTAVAARLADSEAERPVPMEEVIVVNESEWRLPDLGSEWRRAQADGLEQGRIELAFLPLYDPENSDPTADLFERNSELHRLDMIEVIRFRFGGRPQD
jgi:hypothetical protein